MKRVIFLFCLFLSSTALSSEPTQIQIGKSAINLLPPSELTEITPKHSKLYQTMKQYYGEDSNQYYAYYFDFESFKKNASIRICTIYAPYKAMDSSFTLDHFKAAKQDIYNGLSSGFSELNFSNRQDSDNVGYKSISTKWSIPLTHFHSTDESELYFTQKEYVGEMQNQKIAEKENFSIGFLLLRDKFVGVQCLSPDNDIEWSKQQLIKWSGQLVEINRPNLFIRLWDKFLYLVTENEFIRVIFIILLIQLGRKFFVKEKK